MIKERKKIEMTDFQKRWTEDLGKRACMEHADKILGYNIENSKRY